MPRVSRDDLQRVTPTALRAYLERRSGRHETDTLARGAGRYYEVRDTDDALLVLASTQNADYSRRMAENLDVLADYGSGWPKRTGRSAAARRAHRASTRDARLGVRGPGSTGKRLFVGEQVPTVVLDAKSRPIQVAASSRSFR